jgi:ParB/RepB/Spo0J family partition protein
MLIPLDRISQKRRDLRRALDPEKIRLLAEDIDRNGLLQPIAVGKLDSDRYRLIAGRRRIAAHKLLGRTEIEAHVMDDSVSDEIRGAAENIQRVQLTPLEEADIVGDLHDIDKLSINDIADLTGHGNSWVQDRLALLSLPETFQDAIHHRYLSIAGALLLSTITETDYRDYLLHIAKTNGATVHQVQAWVQEWTARTAMLRPGGFTGPIPQLPPLPQPPPQPCFSCEAPTPNDHVVLVRICTDCLEEFRLMKAAATDQLPPTDGHPVELHHSPE